MAPKVAPSPFEHEKPFMTERLCLCNLFIYASYLGAGRGNRTPMELPPADFESAASASSAIPALLSGSSDCNTQPQYRTASRQLQTPPAACDAHSAIR